MSILSVLLLLIVSNKSAAQNFEPGEVLPEISIEEKAERGFVNALALIEAYISHMQKLDISAAEAGRFAGELFAESWPEELTPENFVELMNSNWQMYNVTTEILETGDYYVKARRDRIASDEEFAQVFSVPLNEIEKFLEHVQKGITSFHGLSYSEYLEGDSIVFTVSEAQ